MAVSVKPATILNPLPGRSVLDPATGRDVLLVAFGRKWSESQQGYVLTADTESKEYVVSVVVPWDDDSLRCLASASTRRFPIEDRPGGALVAFNAASDYFSEVTA